MATYYAFCGQTAPTPDQQARGRWVWVPNPPPPPPQTLPFTMDFATTSLTPMDELAAMMDLPYAVDPALSDDAIAASLAAVDLDPGAPSRTSTSQPSLPWDTPSRTRLQLSSRTFSMPLSRPRSSASWPRRGRIPPLSSPRRRRRDGPNPPFRPAPPPSRALLYRRHPPSPPPTACSSARSPRVRTLTFPSGHQLKKHTNKHTRPFACAVCGKGHAAQKDLDRHLWARHAQYAAEHGRAQ